MYEKESYTRTLELTEKFMRINEHFAGITDLKENDHFKFGLINS